MRADMPLRGLPYLVTKWIDLPRVPLVRAIIDMKTGQDPPLP